MLKKNFIGIVYAAFISILIGITAMLLITGTLNRPFSVYVWNAGYSLCLGLPLFANGYLFHWFEKRYIDWINKPVKSVAAALSIHFGYSSVVIFIVNWFWFVVVLDQELRNFWASNTSMIISEYIIFVIVAAIIYAISFFRAWRSEVTQSEEIKREALSLKYQVLQNQVNPHFLFNSLNVLGSLIDIDSEKAKEFTRELSLFYRDVLHYKDQDIISLKEEIAFVKKYIYLQQIRFGEALEVEIIANENIRGRVIPLSLQALVENAVKHNEISKANPLKIVIAITDDYELIVENNIQSKKVLEPGSGTGLKNLASRYEFLTGKKVNISENNRYFRVILPLIVLDGK
ncbi:histidine kinase [Maribellus comscasis]|uniref:Histidine kinase n=1 Tax=Maribellus comscasis TaxID=2681766 RepID=A0A6I6JRC6_9BACT|nr:histidine kinase [Maribellus comscasis]QGY43618.1 histidine kinase [Maribellus comscasis]